MFRLAFASICLSGFIFAVATAQQVQEKVKVPEKKEVEKEPYKEATKQKDTTAPKPARAPATPGDVEVYFLNGSKVRMIVQSESLEIATQYGKLAVPIKDVRSIDFGLHYPEDMEAKIDAAIKGLGSNDYREREKADKALVDLGPYSYPAVVNASRLRDQPEMSKRAKDIVAKLQTKHAKKDLKTNLEDRVVTPNFTIVGRILTSTVKTKTEYFGEQELALAKMRTLRAIGGASIDMELAIDSGKYANPGQWLDTGFQVDGQTGIVITATGFIDVWPQQGGGFMSGPNGYQYTQNMRNGGMNPNFMKGGRRVGAINGNQHGGMLLGKIGEDGEVFMVGERYDGAPDAQGKLFLHIGPSQWNCQCIGNYDVKINVKND